MRSPRLVPNRVSLPAPPTIRAAVAAVASIRKTEKARASPAVAPVKAFLITCSPPFRSEEAVSQDGGRKLAWPPRLHEPQSGQEALRAKAETFATRSNRTCKRARSAEPARWQGPLDARLRNASIAARREPPGMTRV